MNHRNSIWIIFSKFRLLATRSLKDLTRSLKQSIAQGKYVRLKWDQKFSILWLEIDDPYVCPSVLFANLHCMPAIRQFSFPQSGLKMIGNRFPFETVSRK